MKFRGCKITVTSLCKGRVNLCQKPVVVSVMFSFRLIRMGYGAAARCMDRHRRHFTLWPFAPVNLAYLAIALLCLLRCRLHPLRCCGRRLVIQQAGACHGIINGSSIWVGLLTLVWKLSRVSIAPGLYRDPRR